MREEVCRPGGERALGGGDAIGMRGEGPTQGLGGRARADGAYADRTFPRYMFDVALSSLAQFDVWCVGMGTEKT